MSPANAKLNAFPVFLRVDGEAVAIVGNGEEALAKARLLAQSNATLRIIADNADPELLNFIATAGAVHVDVAYDAAHLEDAAMVFAASGDEALDRRVVEDARRLGIPVNAVDRPELCDFFTPALVNRAPVAIAIGTEGAGPVLAQLLRVRIDRMLSPSLGRLAALASSFRTAAERLPKGNRRRRFWSDFFAGLPAKAVEAGEFARAHSAALELLTSDAPTAGHIALVGAGPGAEDLLTLRAHRLLMEADAIVYDALVPEAIVAMGRRDAERLPVGKRKGCHSKSQEEINALLIELGRAGKRVVRLKSGDPLVFGRAGEEMAALREAGIAYEVVPGVTAAFAAAADFELPLTLRGVTSSMVFTTGHDLKGNSLPDWAKLAISGATVAVYMGRSVAAEVAGRLIEAGLSPDTAVAVVENASLGNRRRFHGTLADLPSLEARADLTGPVMTIIGDAVAGANFEQSEPLAAHTREDTAGVAAEGVEQ
ncbi:MULTISPECIES: siroheme synthase CysG [unclassified Mesorhizobium]|uniref:siroheme synthase CysG n=5 Tax=Mesorhizobium TaxID=68287 RepID=UPI000BAF5CC3|nr:MULTISPECIES: siroheme synthase CysG [unclassified Mesorhizobium]PBB36437.1 uroporphyrinogen-III C-methyltransferase [Mesorhizobium sp. WSM3882]RUW00383.1 uroporphyrinogen-III C-methyltransferase [Mesorhizobium sp. M1A.F.Ca.IN.020.04.1.1]RWH05668.1 MAG: uroporphyrinogen-III C-methyltransferase [Mesorhizobium sp.]RWI96785.1 MAG: uroporphyrinogen-III C-methyltransferase [Mesorhizobium sp.]RWM90332.1 MAG: uroporphyrinogen-III C-methyltransferase [Mesorhizobium sp.]